MYKSRHVSFLMSVFPFIGLVTVTQTVSADIAAECKQEAKNYGIVAELQDDYVQGCVESRGGGSVSVEESATESVTDPEPEASDVEYSENETSTDASEQEEIVEVNVPEESSEPTIKSPFSSR